MATEISVIIPALNEAENLPLLLPRIAAALSGRSYEVIIVDDGSRDNTVAVHTELARQYPTHLIVRPQPKNGLSGAILEGMAHSSGEYLVVMDADLQHPPEKLPELLRPLENGTSDFVIGSRYVSGGTTQDSWGMGRRLNSWVATVLARPFAGATRDPMSGYFALRRKTYEGAERLTPLGYKIALELMCKCRVGRIVEVPIDFGLRAKGESKLNFKQQLRYLDHLSRLYDYTFVRAVPLVKFMIVLALSWGVGALICLLLRHAGLALATAVALSYGGALTVTAAFHVRYVNIQREYLLRQKPWQDFALISLIEWCMCIVAAFWCSRRIDNVTAWDVFFGSFGVATVVRYVLRKELLQDVRGLRRDPRSEDIRGHHAPRPSASPR